MARKRDTGNSAGAQAANDKPVRKRMQFSAASPERELAAVLSPPVPDFRGGKPSALLDTRVIYCGDCLEQLKNLPPTCIDLIYIDPPFNSNRNYEVFWGERKEKRAFEDRHASTQAYIDYMRPRCIELARVLILFFQPPSWTSA
ncbi:MAG: site-specific DNA-methyltransferase [Phycisphaeraceae bacterium]|nr:site-specific DNA-methyltransferase [Phycisphaeraceae bacterium]